MYSFVFTNQFRKDYKLCKKRNYPFELLQETFELLAEKGNLPQKYKAHKLSGDFSEYFECHIKPDWLLIWKTDEIKMEITLYRTGSHADLFK